MAHDTEGAACFYCHAGRNGQAARHRHFLTFGSVAALKKHLHDENPSGDLTGQNHAIVAWWQLQTEWAADERRRAAAERFATGTGV